MNKRISRKKKDKTMVVLVPVRVKVGGKRRTTSKN